MIEPLHSSKSLSLSICFVRSKMSRLIQPYLRGHEWQVMNDDCDGLRNVKSYINEKEHQSYFFRSVACIPLPTATVRPLSTDHRLLQTLGRRKGAAGLALPEQKAELAMGVEHRARNQIPGWQAAPKPTGFSWWQMTTGFCNQSTKNRCLLYFWDISGKILEI